MAHFKHPQDSGRVHQGEDSYPIFAGVVDCPAAIGLGADWPRASEAEIEAFKKASKKAAKAEDTK